MSTFATSSIVVIVDRDQSGRSRRIDTVFRFPSQDLPVDRDQLEAHQLAVVGSPRSLPFTMAIDREQFAAGSWLS